ncbi:MAG: squalene synthase HpnC [Phycisphaeraceae bacterium]
MTSAILDDLATYGPQGCAPCTPEEAEAYTRRLTETHYENFTVVSRLVPAELRRDFRNVYAFCRAADDLGDETGNRERSLELLAWWRKELAACYAGKPGHPIFIALRRTVEAHDLPSRPFEDLISAFEQDQRVTRYDTWDGVLDYCKRSADPVGRLVLMLFGYRDEHRFELSDATCTALQLVNFWQDVRRDVLERDRVYLPRDVASEAQLDVDAMAEAIRKDAAAGGDGEALKAVRPAFVKAMGTLMDRTWPLFEKGHALPPTLATPRLRATVRLFSRGGEAVMKKIESQGLDTLSRRPKLSKADKLGLLANASLGRLMRL